jgi:hypothetical protein
MTTLTVDGSPEESGELSAEEQDSLAVGEQMAQEQEQLFAGKYKNAEELESAYIELQKKLGSSDDDAPAEEAESEDAPEDTTSFLDEIWEQSQSEYKEETLEKLRGMDPTELANMYLEYRNEASKQAPQPRAMPEQVVTQLKGIVGGDANYKNMTTWASTNLSKEEISMFDQVMDGGDPNAAFFAINSLAQRYQDAVGFDGKMLTGKASTSSKAGFRSQAEMIEAMQDPRYDRDPAYRQEVMQKLESSDVDF